MDSLTWQADDLAPVRLLAGNFETLTAPFENNHSMQPPKELARDCKARSSAADDANVEDKFIL